MKKTALILILSVMSGLSGLRAQDTLNADTAAATPGPQTPESISQDRSELDEELRSRLQAIFDRVGSLAGVEVEVEAGIVRLVGTIPSSEAGERAEGLARAQEAVLFVENRLEVTSSLSERLEPTWDRLRDLAFGAVAILPLLAVALLIVVASMGLGRMVALWGGPSFLGTRNPFLQNLLGRIIQAAIVLAGVLVALDLLDATALVGAVAGTAGLAGLAVGFAFKDVVENYLAGLLLALRQPFEPNDHVVVESHEGKVVRLTPRETILMTLDGNHVRLPNAMIFRSAMLNYTRNPLRRFHFDVGIGTADDIVLARSVGQATLERMEGVADDPPPSALVRELGDSTVVLRYFGWVDQREADFGRVRSEAIRSVKDDLERAGVSMPSPEYVLRWSGEGAPAPGEAATPTGPPEVDVSVDRSLDRQIEADRRTSDEENLLEPDEARSPVPGQHS